MLSFLSENMVVLTLTCLAVVILLVIIFLMKVAIKHGKQGSGGFIADYGHIVANGRFDATGSHEGDRLLGHPVDRGQILRTGLVREIPEAFEADHALDIVPVFSAGLCMNAATHRLGAKMRWFLVCESHEADVAGLILRERE